MPSRELVSITFPLSVNSSLLTKNGLFRFWVGRLGDSEAAQDKESG